VKHIKLIDKQVLDRAFVPFLWNGIGRPPPITGIAEIKWRSLIFGIGAWVRISSPANRGTSLTAAGWRLIGETPGRSWSCPSRPRVDKHPLQGKLLFEKSGTIP